MNITKIDQLKLEIQELQTKLNHLYSDPAACYEDVLKLSQELDILIVNCQKLIQASDHNSKLHCA